MLIHLLDLNRPAVPRAYDAINPANAELRRGTGTARLSVGNKPIESDAGTSPSGTVTRTLRGCSVSNEGDSADEAETSIGGMPDADNVKSRAEGRPPEEESSEDPAAQADAILQDSEDRIAEGSDGSDR
jgi:hypothetical protein